MDNDEAIQTLLSEIAEAAKAAERAGRWWDGWNRTLWWLGVAVAGTAILVGYLGSLPPVSQRIITPWMVSAIASAGGAIEVIRRRTGWEALGNAYWAKYVDLIELARRLRLGIDDRPEGDPVRTAVEDLADLEDRFGMERNSAITERERPAKV